MAISPRSLWKDRPDDWLSTTDADDAGHDS
jgi:hypothetical protein